MSCSKHDDSETSTFFCRCFWSSQVLGGQIWQIHKKIHKVLESHEGMKKEGRGNIHGCPNPCNQAQQQRAAGSSPEGLLPGRGDRKAYF